MSSYKQSCDTLVQSPWIVVGCHWLWCWHWSLELWVPLGGDVCGEANHAWQDWGKRPFHVFLIHGLLWESKMRISLLVSIRNIIPCWPAKPLFVCKTVCITLQSVGFTFDFSSIKKFYWLDCFISLMLMHNQTTSPDESHHGNIYINVIHLIFLFKDTEELY